jgi:hypothetical protein
MGIERYFVRKLVFFGFVGRSVKQPVNRFAFYDGRVDYFFGVLFT